MPSHVAFALLLHFQEDAEIAPEVLLQYVFGDAHTVPGMPLFIELLGKPCAFFHTPDLASTLFQIFKERLTVKAIYCRAVHGFDGWLCFCVDIIS